MNIQALRREPACAPWSNRILILSLLGIGYLTLFPFQFHPGAFRAIRGVPFFLGNSGKEYFTRDFFLNVLLFVPFGFGVSAQVRKRNGGLLKCFLWSLALGAFVSYSVEFMQLYIPERDSGWDDVFSNTTGSVVGFFLFTFLSGPLLESLSRCEGWILSRLSPSRTAVLFLAYFAAAFGISAYLQSETRLSNWDPRCVLFVGNDAAGEAAWAGKVFLLEIWNRALPPRTIQRLAASESAGNEGSGLLAHYDFRSPGPFQDRNKLLPPLSWEPGQPRQTDAGAPELGDKAWLSTRAPVENLTRDIEKTSKFTIRMVCLPDAIERGSGRMVSLSQSADNVNFHLRQRGADLVFYFRNSLTETRSILAWPLPGVFQAGKVRDIAAVYDGSDAYVYIDGQVVPRNYRLGPGVSLFHAIRFVQTPELGGYIVVYDTILFLPAGMLLGFEARKSRRRWIAGPWLLASGYFLPAVLYEALLVVQTGRRIWPGNIGLSLAFELAGMLLINADRLPVRPMGDQQATIEDSSRAEKV
jgi:glycopeptide antibiotics resistance protein